MNKFQRFRKLFGLKQCIRCGEKPSINHHYYCDKCWKYNQYNKMTNQINKNATEAIRRKAMEQSLRDSESGLQN